MRRPFFMVLVLGIIALAGAGLVAWPGLGMASQEMSASPPAEKGWTRTIATVEPAFVNPDPNSEESIVLTQKRVEFEKGGKGGDQHVHENAFVLTVAEGGICYHLVSNTYLTPVMAYPSNNDPAPSGPCEPTILPGECSSSGCELVSGDTIFLPTGSSLTQANDTTHGYDNASDTEIAVVFLAELQIWPPPGLGCNGGCY